jgi:hypothetical protein
MSESFPGVNGFSPKFGLSRPCFASLYPREPMSHPWSSQGQAFARKRSSKVETAAPVTQ